MTQPSFLDLFRAILAKIESANIDYMVVGSMASMVYGEPRLTQDMDLVVQLSPQQVRRFPDLFDSAEFYLPPLEILIQEALERRSFNVLHVASGLKIDFNVQKTTAHAREEFDRRRRIPLLPGFSAFVAAPEDVILKKLQFFEEGRSQKHLQDIRGILANTEIDEAYLARWISELRLEPAWNEAKS